MNNFVREHLDAFLAIIAILTVLLFIIPSSIISTLIGVIIGAGAVYIAHVSNKL